MIEFILSAEEIESLKLKHIRSQLFVSNATIIRACKKLNYATFNELKYTVVHCKKRNQSFSATMSLSPVEKIQKEFVVLLTESMEKAAQEVCHLLLNADYVYCSGIDVGATIAAAFVQKQAKHPLAAKTDYFFVPTTQLSELSRMNGTILLFGLSQEIQHFVPLIQESKQFGTQIGWVTESMVSVDIEPKTTIPPNSSGLSALAPELRLAILSTLISEMMCQATE